MNREIKFRAWDHNNLVMYHSDRDEDNGEGLIVWRMDANGIRFEELQLIDTCPGGMYHKQELEYRDPLQTIMQYTGLKDRNGVEVYEGDIVSSDYTDEGYAGLHEVKFAYGGFMIWGGKPKGYRGSNFQSYARNFTVVGNIHQHPELLTTPN